MKIGVDLRALQIGHQYRGVGEVVKRTLDEMFKFAVRDNNSFVFYAYSNLNNPTELLHIPKELDYKTINLGESPLDSVRSKAQKVTDAFEYLYGNPIKQAKQCDVFLQYDYALGVPTNTPTVLIKHDIIPFIFWDQFFESPMVPLRNKAARTTLRTLFHNYRSKHALRRALSNAKSIATVSENTRQDLHRRFRTPLKKMQTVLLGVDASEAKSTGETNQKLLPTKPFLLFIGGVDRRRRRVDELIAAYNNLKADGHDIQLVLVGENFQSPESVPEGPVRDAVMGSSYKNDILTLGYIDDATKQRLFKTALAFVFPSVYEGFGIPVLEAMLWSCPVIAYKNSSIPEVGGDFALYATGWQGIESHVSTLLTMSDSQRKQLVLAAKQHAENFTWERTAHSLYEMITRA